MKAFVIKNKEGEYFDGDSAFGNLIYTDDLSYAEIYTPNERKRISDNDLKRNGEYFAEVYISEVNLEEENRVLKRAFDKMLADLMNYVREYQENSTNEYAIACCKDILSQMWHTRHNQDLFIEQAKGGKDEG